jgi:ornithine--oxo-acid transaminase
MTVRTSTPPALGSVEHIQLTEQWAAHNYHPLPVVLSSGDGAWVTDVDGQRYLDCLAGYSALNFGHANPRLLAVAHQQLDQLTLTSRAFFNDQLGVFARDLAAMCDKDMVLPMNTGAEAVETALKVARRWGYEVKGVPADQATIIVMDGNFHGRTTTIVSFSTDELARRHFAPFTPGFRTVPYGNAAALEAAIDHTTVGVLIEPIQGEGGVIIPPEAYLQEVRALCDRYQVLMMADEIQSGLGRTGRTFACDHEQVVPDLYILGKALGGGLYPVSAVVADNDVLGVITPGSHGSTFGGNPLAAALGREVVAMLSTGEIQQRSTELGRQLHDGLEALVGHGVKTVRSRGLWAGVDVNPELLSGRQLCESLLERGVLAKDTHGSTIRLAPPLVATEEDIAFLLAAFQSALVDAHTW